MDFYVLLRITQAAGLISNFMLGRGNVIRIVTSFCINTRECSAWIGFMLMTRALNKREIQIIIKGLAFKKEYNPPPFT